MDASPMEQGMARAKPERAPKTAYTRWTPAEYLRIAVHVLPYVGPQMDVFTLMRKGMRAALPRERWRMDIDLRKMSSPSQSIGMRRALELAESLTEKQREDVRSGALIIANPTGGLRILSTDEAAEERHPEPAPSPMPQAERMARANEARSKLQFPTGESRVYWTDREWALLARRVKHWQDTGRKGHLSTLYALAQDIELPPDRRRPPRSLYGKNTVEPHHREGLDNAWTVAQSFPFDPGRMSYVDPAMTLLHVVESAQVPSDTAEPTGEVAPAVVPVEPQPPPVEQQAPAAAPAPSPQPRSSIAEASRAAADEIQRG